MNVVIKISGVSTLLLTLTGCADFQLPQLPQLPTPAKTPPVVKEIPAVKDSAQQICETAAANELRAKELYVGKNLTVTAEFNYVKENQYITKGANLVDNYLLTLTIKDGSYHGIGIFAETKDRSNKQAVLSLSEGQKLTITGRIFSIGTTILCGISMENIVF